MLLDGGSLSSSTLLTMDHMLAKVHIWVAICNVSSIKVRHALVYETSVTAGAVIVICDNKLTT